MERRQTAFQNVVLTCIQIFKDIFNYLKMCWNKINDIFNIFFLIFEDIFKYLKNSLNEFI